MADTATIVFANHTADHVPGDEATLPAEEARRLVDSGMANYATVTQAKAAGDPEPHEHAATQKKK